MHAFKIANFVFALFFEESETTLKIRFVGRKMYEKRKMRHIEMGILRGGGGGLDKSFGGLKSERINTLKCR